MAKASDCPPSLRFHALYELLTSEPLPLSLDAKFKSPVEDGMYMLYGSAALPLAPLVLARVKNLLSPLAMEPSTSSLPRGAVVELIPIAKEPLVLKKMLLAFHGLLLMAVFKLMGMVAVLAPVEVTKRVSMSPAANASPEMAEVVSVKVRSPALMFCA